MNKKLQKTMQKMVLSGKVTMNAMLGFLFLLSLSLGVKTNIYAQDELHLGEGGTNTSSFSPNYYLYGYSYSQTIYLASELTALGALSQPAMITKIKYLPNASVSTQYWSDWVVYIGNTTKTGFTSNTDWVSTANMTQVFNGQLGASVTANQWVEITLTTPFQWDGSSNLVIAVDENTPSWGGDPQWKGYTLAPSSGNKVIYYYSDATNPDPASPPAASNRNNIAGQIMFVGNFLPTCAGNPDAGTAEVYGGANVCVDVDLYLNATGQSGPSNGLTFQWQSTATGQNNWTDIAGATTPQYTLVGGVDEETELRLIAHCAVSNLSDTSDVLSLTIKPSNECYCIPAGTNANSYINAFSTTGGIMNVNLSGLTQGPNAYSDFTATDTIQQDIGDAIDFAASYTGGTFGTKVWVDWNQDGIFSSDELVFLTSSFASSSSGSFDVPLDAAFGATRMRIGISWSTSSGPAGPCETNGSFAWNDYTFVVSGSACDTTGTPNDWALLTSTDTICNIGNVTLSLSDVVGAMDVTYQFQSSIDGATWTDLGTVSNASSYSLSDVDETFYARALWFCDGVLIDSTDAVEVFVEIPAILNVEDAKICLGNAADLTAEATAGHEVYWFADADAEQLLHEGEDFTTPVLTGTTSYYVAAGTGVTEQNPAWIGNGTTAITTTPSPFYTSYWGNKAQYIILASELYAMGFIPGEVTGIGFDVLANGGLPMNGFTIKMGATTQSVATSTMITGLTTVYEHTGALNLIANSENTFEFDMPFEWDGASNIVIETCFANGTWSGGHGVKGGAVGFIASTYQYQDSNPNFCSAPAGTIGTSSSRPNIKFYMESGCLSALQEVVVEVFDGDIELDLEEEYAVCNGEVLVLDAGAGYDEYAWSDNSTGQTLEVTESGDYTITVELDGGCIGEHTFEVLFYGPSATGIIATDLGAATYSFVAEDAADVDTYAWDFGDGNTSTDANPEHTYTSNGTYEVTLTLIGEDDCELVLTTDVEVTTVNINEMIKSGEGLVVYPNPAQDYVIIELTEGFSMTAVQVQDITGRVLMTENMNATSSHTLSTSHLSVGVYHVLVETNHGVITKKIEVIR